MGLGNTHTHYAGGWPGKIGLSLRARPGRKSGIAACSPRWSVRDETAGQVRRGRVSRVGYRAVTEGSKCSYIILPNSLDHHHEAGLWFKGKYNLEQASVGRRLAF